METASVNPQQHEAFLASDRTHILMLTTHGVHEWQVVPGLPDTGGQNVFVNHFSDALVREGYRITIANRGGYPHPRTGERRSGLQYQDEHQRLFLLEDGREEFVRKEDMGERVSDLAGALESFVGTDGTAVDLIISHYWDAAAIGEEYRHRMNEGIPHVWVPHSLGAIKKRNVPSSDWEGLRIDERISVEQQLVAHLDGIAATSSIIQSSLREDYAYSGLMPFLPPCVDPERFHPREVAEDDVVWEFLSERSGLSPEEIQGSKIVAEISRTDRTKRKDVLIRAFARTQKSIPESFLIVSIDESHPELAAELTSLLDELGVAGRTATLGSVWDILPTLYAISDVYCTPSVMEGFGMAAQEAAATGVPVVASHLVPLAAEYLLGEVRQDSSEGPTAITVGEGAIVVPAEDVDGFAEALTALLTDDGMRTTMGARALEITIPEFTWESRTRAFLEAIKPLVEADSES